MVFVMTQNAFLKIEFCFVGLMTRVMNVGTRRGLTCQIFNRMIDLESFEQNSSCNIHDFINMRLNIFNITYVTYHKEN